MYLLVRLAVAQSTKLVLSAWENLRTTSNLLVAQAVVNPGESVPH